MNEGYGESCLEVAEELANQTPVRLDLLLSLLPPPESTDTVLVGDKSEPTSVSAPSLFSDSRPSVTKSGPFPVWLLVMWLLTFAALSDRPSYSNWAGQRAGTAQPVSCTLGNKSFSFKQVLA